MTCAQHYDEQSASLYSESKQTYARSALAKVAVPVLESMMKLETAVVILAYSNFNPMNYPRIVHPFSYVCIFKLAAIDNSCTKAIE